MRAYLAGAELDLTSPSLWEIYFFDWEVVFYAAVFRAFDMAKTRMKEAISSMQKGQLVLLGKTDPRVSQFQDFYVQKETTQTIQILYIQV